MYHQKTAILFLNILILFWLSYNWTWRRRRRCQRVLLSKSVLSSAKASSVHIWVSFTSSNGFLSTLPHFTPHIDRFLGPMIVKVDIATTAVADETISFLSVHWNRQSLPETTGEALQQHWIESVASRMPEKWIGSRWNPVTSSDGWCRFTGTWPFPIVIALPMAYCWSVDGGVERNKQRLNKPTIQSERNHQNNRALRTERDPGGSYQWSTGISTLNGNPHAPRTGRKRKTGRSCV